MKKITISILFFIFFLSACTQTIPVPEIVNWSMIRPGDARTEIYFPLLKGKRIALVANHTSMIGTIHLADTLLNSSFELIKVFTPEHGFRGNAEAGAHIKNEIDSRTGLPIISLYGDHRKPAAEDLVGIDIILFDLQDVGTRFYTYVSTMIYIMEACSENDIQLIILDRPNPNGFYVDGPILQSKHKSFVGMHSIPIVHGLTLGEYALMVNGEGFLENKLKCNLEVITVENYSHNLIVDLPIQPSPNLPNLSSILLYPSLCLFEGTTVSIGRGTNNPFEVIGHPEYSIKEYSFTPISIKGASEYPPQENKKCFGKNLKNYYSKLPVELGKIELGWIIDFYQNISGRSDFFNSYFEKLSGTDDLRKQIEDGLTNWEIHQSWKENLDRYKKIRAKYLLYPDFE
jgi:uncharacterized protein YbbC (DUF1343 family)